MLKGYGFGFDLDSDIWFPRVIGAHLPEEFKARRAHSPDGMLDNSELALRHTPRLNRFLAEVRAGILELGGTWEVAEAEELAVRYAPWVSEHGIDLEPRPAALA